MSTSLFKFAAFVILGFLVVFAAYTVSVQAQDATSHSSVSANASPLSVFTRNLTVGSRGSDVSALQSWLIVKGFNVPAGATGYFGGQTRAALARYQASEGIQPAVGYFGLITRTRIIIALDAAKVPEATRQCFLDPMAIKSSGVDGQAMLKAYPGLQPVDFVGVHGKDEGGDYSVLNGQLVFTGNAASDSGDLTCNGLRTVLKNAAKRLDLPSQTKLDIEQLILKIKSPV